MTDRPLMPLLRTARLALTAPLLPVSPESPLMATGLPTAVELAPPVSPVLVEEDCAVDAPELPETAVGVWEPLTSPPSPPLALTLAMESPPVTLPMRTRLWPPTRTRLRASPARPERAVARSPPLPPKPPSARPLTSLETLPVS